MYSCLSTPIADSYGTAWHLQITYDMDKADDDDDLETSAADVRGTKADGVKAEAEAIKKVAATAENFMVVVVS
jgi:hypothetical protein